MMTRSILILIASLILAEHHDGATQDPKLVLGVIAMALEKNQIGRVEILQIPSRILTRAQIGSAALENEYHNKLIIRDIGSTRYRKKLADSLYTVSAQVRADTADLRWGVIFYSRNETRLGAVFFDRSGQYGAVNNISVSFKGDFFHWLDATFSDCFD